MQKQLHKNHPLFSILFLAVCLLFVSKIYAQGELTFQVPPKEILDLVDIKQPPTPIIDRTMNYIVFVERPTFKTLKELAENELRLAGIRINTQAFDGSRGTYFTGISLQNLKTGKNIEITGLPKDFKIEYPAFSPSCKYFSFVNVTEKGMELWLLTLNTGIAKKVSSEKLSAVTGTPYRWSADEKFLYCYLRNNSKPTFKESALPTGPAVQEATGIKAPVRTYQDLLRDNNDEVKFEYYATSPIVKIFLDGKTVPYLPARIYKSFEASPDGNYTLVEEVNKPFSYQVPYFQFPYNVKVFDKNGTLVKELASKPLQDKIPTSFDAVESGRRDFSWRGDKPATLVWCEAQDGGDPAVPAIKRDKIFQSDAPFKDEGKFLTATLNRFRGITWGDNSTAVMTDSWRKNRNTKSYLLNPENPDENPKIIYDGSSEDLYNNPGRFVTEPNKFNEQTLLFSKDKSKLYLIGEGFSAEGNKPFVDEYIIKTGDRKRLWRADGKNTYEAIVRILDIENNQILTRIEGQKVFPNYFIRNIGSPNDLKQITFLPNPYKSFENVSKQKISYKREDGVDLTATLYLPAGYDKSKGRLPMLMEAYPTEFKDAGAAGMVRDSPHRFVSLNYGSPVFWAARGYAVMQGASFPIIGKGNEEPNDTYIEQLVANAKAAIKAVDDMGVVDPKRVAVMGHSYGAFMTANLLAHSDLFAAGIARSGAYNRTLTPFGFQSEERTFWQAKDVYNKMSPFNYADQLKTPILLIHGEMDNNSGTFPINSERLFAALKGLGGTARLVFLPYESHGYAARENILHMLWEMDSWLEKYVKNRK